MTKIWHRLHWLKVDWHFQTLNSSSFKLVMRLHRRVSSSAAVLKGRRCCCCSLMMLSLLWAPGRSWPPAESCVSAPVWRSRTGLIGSRDERLSAPVRSALAGAHSANQQQPTVLLPDSLWSAPKRLDKGLFTSEPDFCRKAAHLQLKRGFDGAVSVFCSRLAQWGVSAVNPVHSAPVSLWVWWVSDWDRKRREQRVFMWFGETGKEHEDTGTQNKPCLITSVHILSCYFNSVLCQMSCFYHI